MIVKTREQLNSNMECPYCPTKTMYTNGCGGKGSKFVNFFLNKLPSSKLFYGSCCAHDILYALVCKDAVQIEYNDSSYVLENRKDVDDFWLKLMLDIVKKVGKAERPIMRWAAKRNYKFVRKYGDSFFKHEH